jgi:hypothetical protein
MIANDNEFSLSLLLSFTYHSSQFEEKFEEINGAEELRNIPSTSGLNENPAPTMVTEDRGKDVEIQGQEDDSICADPAASQDFMSGIMKIVPSDVNVSSASKLPFPLSIWKMQYSKSIVLSIGCV